VTFAVFQTGVDGAHLSAAAAWLNLAVSSNRKSLRPVFAVLSRTFLSHLRNIRISISSAAANSLLK
jgi:hypothetical protein